MESVSQHILRKYGKEGEAWIQSLPSLLEDLKKVLKINELKEFENLSYHYVFEGLQGDKPIVLKVSPDQKSISTEGFALEHFSGAGSINLLEHGRNFLLLERATPGTSLETSFPKNEKSDISACCKLIKQIHTPEKPSGDHFPYLRDWLERLDKPSSIPLKYQDKAQELKDKLIETSPPDILLHGDLHHGNILKHKDTYVTIDPKGVLGDPAYEVGAFIRNPLKNLTSHPDAGGVISKRVSLFSELLTLDPQRIKDWCFVQAVLGWIWALDDGTNTQTFSESARLFEALKL